ncbi:MAG: hypothetical protein ACLPWF_32825 [Bryobacteraceae bacterium]
MVFTIRSVVLLSLWAGLGFAGTWSGHLVDAKCYAAEERNVNPTDTETYVDRDGMEELRYCHPRLKTKSFTIVQFDGQSVNLDPAGNAKAAELVQKAGKRHFMYVTVTGEMTGKTIKVDSISETPGP